MRLYTWFLGLIVWFPYTFFVHFFIIIGMLRIMRHKKNFSVILNTNSSVCKIYCAIYLNIITLKSVGEGTWVKKLNLNAANYFITLPARIFVKPNYCQFQYFTTVSLQYWTKKNYSIVFVSKMIESILALT